MELNSIKEIEERLDFFNIDENYDKFIKENPILFNIDLKNFLKIKVYWKDDYEGIIDVGIMISLPGYVIDEFNFIVSFPNPYYEYNPIEPVYIHILDLITNNLIGKIEIIE